MTTPLAGRSALVTGGTRGIGRAIAERLRDEGAAVTVTGTQPQGEAPSGCAYEPVDFGDTEATEAFATRVETMELDVLVNNAGINRIAPFADIETEDFDAIHRINVRAPFVLCQAVVTGMRARGWGRIVNVSSVFGVVTKEQRGAYSSSKFALDGLTAALAVEVAADGVLANCVAPGFVDTELTRTVLGERGIARMVAGVPIGRLARPEEIAGLVAWLAGPENSYLTGQTVTIDGGFVRV